MSLLRKYHKHKLYFPGNERATLTHTFVSKAAICIAKRQKGLYNNKSAVYGMSQTIRIICNSREGKALGLNFDILKI